jgi:hypothetical protein
MTYRGRVSLSGRWAGWRAGAGHWGRWAVGVGKVTDGESGGRTRAVRRRVADRTENFRESLDNWQADSSLLVAGDT